MSRIQKTILPIFAMLAIALTALAAGCSYSGDTSGYQPEKKKSKAEITQAIAAINANDKMPANAKQMALTQLNKELADAK